MHRRPLGNGRRLAILAAIVIVVGCLLPWYTLGGDGGLPAEVFRGFSDGSGILSFLAGLATLALVALPYAAGERPVGIDRGIAYGAFAVLAVFGLLLWIPTVLDAPQGLFPDRAVGFWLTAVGTAMLGRAAYDISLEPPRR
jgi:hypothetical protein